MTAQTNFFSANPFFLESSQTGANLARLEERHARLIAANRSRLKGKNLLDLGSHDGRWALAALAEGAETAVGIEARGAHIDQAKANASQMRLSEKCAWLEGDVLENMAGLEAGNFDTVLMLGIYYHVTTHLDIMRQIARLDPRHLVIDTVLFSDCAPADKVMAYWAENPMDASSAAHADDEKLFSRASQLVEAGLEVRMLGCKVFPGVADRFAKPQMNAGMPSLAGLKALIEMCFEKRADYTLADWKGSAQGDYLSDNAYRGIGRRYTVTVDFT